MAGLLDVLGGLFSPPQQGILSQGQQGMNLQDLSRGLLMAGRPSPYKKSFVQSLGEATLSAGDMQKQRQPDLKSVKSGEKLIDPATGKVIVDGGPEQMTPYQKAALALSERRLNMSNQQNSGLGKPPTGYRWGADGALEAIPGGPATKLTPEGAAKTAQIDNALGTLPDIKRLLVEPGMLNPAAFYTSSGETGEGRRLIKQAVEGYLRATSGAAVPEVEVQRALDLYEPKPYDKQETRQKKVAQLEKFLQGTGTNIKKGRTLADDMPQQPDASGLSDDDLLRALNGGL